MTTKDLTVWDDSDYARTIDHSWNCGCYFDANYWIDCPPSDPDFIGWDVRLVTCHDPDFPLQQDGFRNTTSLVKWVNETMGDIKHRPITHCRLFTERHPQIELLELLTDQQEAELSKCFDIDLLATTLDGKFVTFRCSRTITPKTPPADHEQEAKDLAAQLGITYF